MRTLTASSAGRPLHALRIRARHVGALLASVMTFELLNVGRAYTMESKAEEGQSSAEGGGDGGGPGFRLLLRDLNPELVEAWRDAEAFGEERFTGLVEISSGDIFKDAPAADAIVSPANSFGFMDGGIDMAYSLHFGWQMMERLQQVLREKWYGELPVGSAAIIPAYPPGTEVKPVAGMNEGRPIQYLVSAPTMRVPMNVTDTPNAYLALRAALIAVLEHNKAATSPEERIGTLLCPGLGTAVGRMPYKRAAIQMRLAYDSVVFQSVKAVNSPLDLGECVSFHMKLTSVGKDSRSRFGKERQQGELYLP